MNKVILAFPTRDSLWQFHLQSRAINVAITPGKNTISGLFSPEEVDIALTQFNAVHTPGNITFTNSTLVEVRNPVRISLPTRFYQLMASTFQLAMRGGKSSLVHLLIPSRKINSMP